MRLSHFVNNQQRGCTFCTLNNVGTVPDETFSHLFYDCDTTRSWHEKFLREHLPVNFFNNDVEKKMFFVTGFNNRYPRNMFLTTPVLLFQYCIWEAKLKKKIPSFHTLNEEFLDLCRKFIWSNSVAHNCCTSNNFPLCRNLGYGGAADNAAEQDGGPAGSPGPCSPTTPATPTPTPAPCSQTTPPPQMNNSLKIVKELDPDRILDKDASNDNFKRDGEAVDSCHTLSSSESESEDEATADGKEKEMEVDQPDTPILTNTAVSPAATKEALRKIPDPAPTAASSATAPVASPAVFQSGSRSGPGTGTDDQVKEPEPGASNSFYNVDPNSKKQIQNSGHTKKQFF